VTKWGAVISLDAAVTHGRVTGPQMGSKSRGFADAGGESWGHQVHPTARMKLGQSLRRDAHSIFNKINIFLYFCSYFTTFKAVSSQ